MAKRIRASFPVDCISLPAEITALRQLSQHALVARLVDAFLAPPAEASIEFFAATLVFEAYPWDWFGWLEEHAPCPARMLAPWLSSMVSALVAVHAAGIAHGDLKPENWLLARRPADPGDLRLADFGSAAVPHCRFPAMPLRTTAYAAPELRADPHARPTAAADVWSLGALVFTAAFAQVPPKPPQLLARIRTGTLSRSADLQKFLLACVSHEPARRPAAAELSENPFLVGRDRRTSATAS